MLKNYIKIAWRSLWKNKITTSVSLFGLILGIACFMLLGTYILNELRYDRFHEKADRIAFVNLNYKSPSDAEAVHTPSTPTAVVPVAKREFTEVEDAARVYRYNSRDIKADNKNFTEKNMILADEALFTIFSFHFIAGDPATALQHPNTIVITEATAQKYFGTSDALGKTLLINEKPWQISGVLEDIPPYSSLEFSMVGSYVSNERSKTESWSSANDLSFLLLKSPDQVEKVQQQFNTFIKNRFKSEFESGYNIWLDLTPLKQVHLSSNASGNLVTYLYILGFIALLLLVIACINFTNLMTAKSAERLNEIGVRKVFGAERKSLIVQFLAESALITFFALAIGLAIAYLLLPSFNSITGLNIGVASWKLSYFLLTILVLFACTTLLAGLWPALVLSKFAPVRALKSNHSTLGSSAVLRKFLVVFQFTVSIAFIIATLVAKKQLNFIQQTDTGMDRSNIVVLDASSSQQKQLASFKAELLNNQNIKNVTASYDSPVNIQGGYSIVVDGRKENEGMSITAIPVDKDFVDALDLKILKGQNFTATDEKLVKLESSEERQYAFMINKNAAESLGFTPEEAVGKTANLNGRQGVIKAVLEDFNFASLHHLITPVVIFAEYNWFGKILIKTTGNSSQAIAAISKTWQEFNPGSPFEYHFLNDEYSELYKAEQRTTTILNIFSAITILVSCLGLFGLAVFTASQRRKEIGIRKVLGASTAHLSVLLSVDFLKLVGLAIIIAAPLAWFATNQWLQDFAYKINMPYGLYVLSGMGAVVIAGITVSFQAIKAAIANPVKSLRTE